MLENRRIRNRQVAVSVTISDGAGYGFPDTLDVWLNSFLQYFPNVRVANIILTDTRYYNRYYNPIKKWYYEEVGYSELNFGNTNSYHIEKDYTVIFEGEISEDEEFWFAGEFEELDYCLGNEDGSPIYLAGQTGDCLASYFGENLNDLDEADDEMKEMIKASRKRFFIKK